MRVAKYLGLFGALWFASCATGTSADNGSKSDWVSCETTDDCGEGEACVEQRCEIAEEEPEPVDTSEPEPEPVDTSEPEPLSSEPEPPDAGPPAEVGPRPGGPTVEFAPAAQPMSTGFPDPIQPSQNEVPRPSLDASAPAEPDVSAPSETIADAGMVDAGPGDAGSTLPCGDDAAVCESFQPAECVLASASSGSDFCASGLTCSQEVQVDGVAEVRSGYADLNCYSSRPNSYDCTCSGGVNDVMFTLMSSDAWDACMVGATTCARRIQL